jgi:hypothetical protein
MTGILLEFHNYFIFSKFVATCTGNNVVLFNKKTLRVFLAFSRLPFKHEKPVKIRNSWVRNGRGPQHWFSVSGTRYGRSWCCLELIQYTGGFEINILPREWKARRELRVKEYSQAGTYSDRILKEVIVNHRYDIVEQIGTLYLYCKFEY